MPITTLDSKTALILIDLQKGIVALPTAHPTAAVVKMQPVSRMHFASIIYRWF